LPKLNCDIETMVYRAADPRADSGSRIFRLAPHGVQIERVVAGVKMRLTVPIDSYQGVVLTCEDKFDQRFCRVTLAHRDPDLSVALHQATDTPAILAVWRS
jgi:hypothetical protein